MWVVALHSLFLYLDPLLGPPCHPPSDWLRLFSSQTFSCTNPPTFSTPVILHTYPPMKMEQSVSKRGHIKLRCRGITQKKEYNTLSFIFIYFLTCQRLIFSWYREPATENVTSPQFTAPEVVTRNHDGGNRKPLSLW